MSQIVLIIDDNASIFDSLQINFRDFGFRCLWGRNEKEALALLAEERVDVVLLDLSLGKEDGLVVLEKIKHHAPALPVIMITGYGTLEKAVKAIKGGAYDFLAKPLDFRKLLEIVRQSLALGGGPDGRVARADVGEWAESGIITCSAAMTSALRKAALLAKTDMPALITGESGCGKELVANYIHARSLRRDGPMVRINCSAFPDTLIDNELFGHEKGAYTGADSSHQGVFEQAHKGTLHLDEIGDMSLSSQAKLLRILEDGVVKRLGGKDERRVDVRFIASTNQNLPEMIKERRFREDLFYRLKAAFIYLPPLRERKGDIRHIAERLLAREGKTFSPAAMAALEAHAWPGNIRELKNTVQMCAVVCAGDVIEAADIPPLAEMPSAADSGGEVRSLEDVEKNAIRKVLEESRFNKRKASQRLGISYKTLYNKMKNYGIE